MNNIFGQLSPISSTAYSPSPAGGPQDDVIRLLVLNQKKGRSRTPREAAFSILRRAKGETTMMAPRSFETKKSSGPTGPTSAAGKETVSRNALVHGLSGR